MILILLLTTAYSQTLTFSFARIQLMLCYRVEGYVTRNVVIIFRSTHYCTVYYHAFISSYIYNLTVCSHPGPFREKFCLRV